ncbi:MAG TPA: cell wall-binding repeat-containing protein, partial [Solirubrobacterales bacterium]|nr:cell wall-binding repeat-containing protein [Solirubrobacterales bacterium]
MLTSARYFIADVIHWLRTHPLVVLGAVVLLAGAAVGVLLVLDDGNDGSEDAPAPRVLVREVEAPEEPAELGFPAFATKNTTRVAGPDPIADAGGVALAVDPSTGGVAGPDAVTIVDAADWPAGIAAASLVANPVGAPILLSEDGELPELTSSALAALAPAGSPDTDGRQVFAIGPAANPDGFDTLEVEGESAAEIAAEIEQVRTRLAGAPEHILVTTSDDPAIAMPAASWAARSGDPVLYVSDGGVPDATREALERHSNVPVYVLGDRSAIPAAVVRELGRIGADVDRVGAEDPVENAIEFARYTAGSFGWNINDPGHGLVIA